MRCGGIVAQPLMLQSTQMRLNTTYQQRSWQLRHALARLAGQPYGTTAAELLVLATVVDDVLPVYQAEHD